MIKVKDGYAKLIGTTYKGSPDWVLLSNGGHKPISDFATASGVVTALGTNGNYVTWTKNGTVNNLTVPYATKSNKLYQNEDLRNENTLPYASADYNKSISAPFLRYNSVDGLNDGGTYHTSIIITPWSDHTGGSAHNIGLTNNGNVWIRSGTTEWTSWKKVAFTDSNVASATKLKTSRTIWGLSFDGTKNVQGALSGATTITTSGNITTGNSTTTSNLSHTVENNNGKIGIYAATRRGLYDYTIGNWLIGTDGTNTRLMIGNVGIGTDSPLYKLHVAGTTSTNLLFIGGSSHPMIIGNGSLLTLGAANSSSKASVVLDLNTDSFRRNSASTAISLGTATYPWTNVYGTNYYGVSHINFKGGEEYFDQYGNFWFGSSSGNWAVFSSDGNPLLKVLHNNGNTIIAGELYVPKVNLDGLSLIKSANVLNISNSYGYILIGPQNKHHCHLYTDLPSFYTNKPILIGGKDALHTGNWSSTITKSALGLGNVQNTAFYKRVATVNGTEWGMAGTINSTAFTIYAPTTPGTSGQVLTSSGGTPTWVNLNSITAGNADTLDGEHGSRYTLTLGGPNYVTITVEGDAATYYPVIIKSVSNKYPMLFVNISREFSETAPDSWNNSTHKGGLTLTLLWNGSRYWDGNSSGAACYCVYKNETYSTMVGGLGNCTAGKVVWLRGGGAVYHIHAMNGTSVTADVHTSTYTDNAKLSFAPRTTVESYDVRWPGYSYGADKLGSSTLGGTYLPIYLSSGTATAGTSYAKAIKTITRSGTTFTYTCIDGTTGTFTQLDSNTTYPVYFKNITTGFKDAFRTQTKGDANSGNYISAIKCDTASIENAPIYSSGIAFGMSDTHGYLYTSYNSALAYIGGGNANKLNWVKQLAFTDSNITGNAASASALYRLGRLDNVDYKADKICSFTHLLINSTIGDNFPFPLGGSSILHMEWDSLHSYSKQLAVGAEGGINKPNNRLKWRAQNDGVWCDWKTVAFTDSNVASATITGDSTMTIIPLLSNEINFGGTNNSLRIYFGYRATDSKPIPTSFIFGGSDGSASLSASKFIKSGGTAALLLRADGNVATFNWSGQNGQPTWLWGGDTQHTYYVYNPANFSVNYATSSGTLKTARTINVTVGGTTGTAQSFDGSKNITIPVSGMGEAYLTWGGKNISGDISPIDAAASLLHSANKFELANPDGITIEYSTNSGSTWLEYSSTDEKKINLVGVNGSNYYYGGSSTASLAGRLRITLNATSMGVYTALKKLLINFSTCGSSGCTVTMETSKKGSETTFSTVGTYSVSGWSGWNSIPCGFAFGGSSNQTGNTAIIRLTFSHTALGSSLTLNPYVININAIGTSNWATPSTIARTGHLYTYDYLGNATFPAKITATKFIGTLNHTLTFSAGKFAANTYNNSAAVTVNIPTHTSHLTNDSGFLTAHLSLANYVTLNSALTITGLKTFESNSSTTGVSLILKNKGWRGNMSTAMDFYNGSNYNVPNARIETKMVGDGTSGGTLIFYTQTKHASTNPNPNGLTERMRIDDNDAIIFESNLHTKKQITLTDNNSYIKSSSGNVIVGAGTSSGFTGGLDSTSIIVGGSNLPTIIRTSANDLYHYRGDTNTRYSILDTGNSSVSGGGSTWGSSITVNLGGISKTLTIPSKPSYSWTDISNKPVYSWSGSSPLDIILANYGTMATNLFISAYLAHGSGSIAMGYKISGYESTPYGGWFGATYSSPWFIGASAGTWSLLNIITDTNYTSYTVKKDGTGASGTWGINITGNAATATNASTATLASTVTVGSGSSNAYRAIVVHNGNSLYSAGNKVLYNYSTGDVKATSFTGKLNGSLVGGAKGNIVYQSATDTTAFLANPSTNGYVLKFNTSTGLPYWASDNNTAYSAMSLTEANVGTKTIPRVITASVLHTKILNQIITSIGYESTGGIEKSGNYISGGGQNIVSALFELDETIKNNIYTLPLAASGTRGGILIGYSESGKNYAVKLSSEKAYVYVPWTDTKVTLTNTTTNANYRVLLSNSVNDNNTTEKARKSVHLTFNPQLLTLYTGNVEISGEIRTTTSGLHPKFRMWHDTTNNALYILSGVKDGSSTSGTIHLSGINATTLSDLYLDSTNTYVAGTILFNKLSAPTTSGGSTYGPGSNGQVLKSNGSTVYWANDNNSYGYIGTTAVQSSSKAQSLTGIINITASGNIIASGEITAYSDRRLKSNIKPLENRGYIQPMTYIKDNKECIGFIAQDVLEKYPELVNDNSEYLSLNYLQYVAVLQALIIELEKRVKELENGTRKL